MQLGFVCLLFLKVLFSEQLKKNRKENKKTTFSISDCGTSLNHYFFNKKTNFNHFLSQL